MVAKPAEFDVVEPELVATRGVRTKKTTKHKPSGLRWVGLKPTSKKKLSKEIDVRKNYNLDLIHIRLVGFLHFHVMRRIIKKC